jgi:hypothetical protein
MMMLKAGYEYDFTLFHKLVIERFHFLGHFIKYFAMKTLCITYSMTMCFSNMINGSLAIMCHRLLDVAGGLPISKAVASVTKR